MSVPVKIVVVFHSGYGHTEKIAEAVGRGAAAIDGASVELVTAEEATRRWELLDGADAIITYMGSPVSAVQSVHGCDVASPNPQGRGVMASDAARFRPLRVSA